MAKHEHSEGLVMVWGDRPPAFSVGFEEPAWPGDSGFTVIFQNTPDAEEIAELENPVDHPDIHTMHACCLLEEFPELVAAFAVAGEHGAADLDEAGGWVGRGA